MSRFVTTHHQQRCLIALCALVLCVACAPLRAPQTPASIEWPRPILPALNHSDSTPPIYTTAPDPDPDRLMQELVGVDVTRDRFDVLAEGVAAGDVFAGLAEHASLSLAVHLPLTNPVWLHLKDRPLRELLDAVAGQCGCRYRLLADRLDILPDEPYLDSYSVDYLNIRREFHTDLRVDTRVGNLATSSAAVQGDASSTALAAQSIADPWQTVLQGLALILGISLEQLPDVVGANREAGLVTVRATQSKHTEVERYLTRVVARLHRQVLIEASVIEVALDERHVTGIDWQQIATAGGIGWVQQLGGGLVDPPSGSGAVLQFADNTSTHTTAATVKLLQQFGDVRVVSSPRIVALNNQPSVLKVVDNAVYFSLNVDSVVNGDLGVDRQSVETAIHTVPIGLVLHVTPQISEHGDVLMNIRPSVTRVVRYARDPNPSLALAGVQNDIPEVQTREIETTLRVKSGYTVALGGLRQLSDGNLRDEVPGLAKLPFIGSAFRSRDVERRQVELLILLTPRVLSASGSA